MGSTAGFLAAFAALILAAPVWAQGGKRSDERAFLIVLFPLGLFAALSLQVAIMAAFPRFSRRCGAAARRYRWQTGLSGLAAFLGMFLVAAVVGSVAQGAAAIPLGLALLAAVAGSVGVSLEVGRWAVRRIGSEAPLHPIVELVVGSSFLGWCALLVPCLGQIAWIIVSCMAMGGFIYALVRGSALDEAPPRQPGHAIVPPPGPLAAPPQPEPDSQAPEGPPVPSGAGTRIEEAEDAGDQVF